MFKLFISAILLAVANFATAADCDVGLYSSYISGVGGPLGTRNEPVVQGGCTKSFANGLYVNGWASQSLRFPGKDQTFTNEIDLTAGWAGKLNEKWSADVHVAYFDFSNPRLLTGTNGDMTNAGGKLQYAATPTTSVYGMAEGYHGIGSLGFPGGWKAGLGAKSTFGPVAVDALLTHNHNFFGRGEFVKLTLESARPIAKFGTGELRPILQLWQPYGRYRNAYEPQFVFGLRMNW